MPVSRSGSRWMMPSSYLGTVREEGVGEPIVNDVVIPADRDTNDADGPHAYDNGIVGKDGGSGSGEGNSPDKDKHDDCSGSGEG